MTTCILMTAGAWGAALVACQFFLAGATAAGNREDALR